VTQTLRLTGTFADALWIASPTPTTATETLVAVGGLEGGSGLVVDQSVGTAVTGGLVTSGTDTFADVASGFSFAVDRGQMASASLSALGIPATTCTIEALGVDINCHPTTIDVTVEWTGQGPITRQTGNEHFNSPGFSYAVHFNGTLRAATGTGTFSGTTLNASDFVNGRLGFGNETVTACLGNGCG
jgi:hypothetical protein